MLAACGAWFAVLLSCPAPPSLPAMLCCSLARVLTQFRSVAPCVAPATCAAHAATRTALGLRAATGRQGLRSSRFSGAPGICFLFQRNVTLGVREHRSRHETTLACEELRSERRNRRSALWIVEEEKLKAGAARAEQLGTTCRMVLGQPTPWSQTHGLGNSVAEAPGDRLMRSSPRRPRSSPRRPRSSSRRPRSSPRRPRSSPRRPISSPRRPRSSPRRADRRRAGEGHRRRSKAMEARAG